MLGDIIVFTAETFQSNVVTLTLIKQWLDSNNFELFSIMQNIQILSSYINYFSYRAKGHANRRTHKHAHYKNTRAKNISMTFLIR